MKIRAFLKLNLKSFAKNLPSMILTFAVFPIFLSLVIGYFQKDAFVPSVENPIINISLTDKDGTGESKRLMEFLQGGEMKKIIKIEDEDSNYQLLIPQGFERGLKEQEPVGVEIHINKDASLRRAEILKNLIDRYSEEISQGLYIGGKIDSMNMSPGDLAEMEDKIMGAYGRSLMENRIVSGKKSLTSYEHHSIVFLSYILFIMLISLNSDSEGKKEVHYRIMASPISKMEYFNCNQASAYLLALLINFIYVWSYRLIGLSFQGSWTILILIVLVESLFLTSVAGFISVVFKEKFIRPILYSLMLLQLILGVTLPTIENMDIAFLKLLASKYSPDVLIQSIFRNYLIYDNLASIKGSLVILIGISLGLYGLSLVKVKWSGNYEDPTA